MQHPGDQASSGAGERGFAHALAARHNCQRASGHSGHTTRTAVSPNHATPCSSWFGGEKLAQLDRKPGSHGRRGHQGDGISQPAAIKVATASELMTWTLRGWALVLRASSVPRLRAGTAGPRRCPPRGLRHRRQTRTPDQRRVFPRRFRAPRQVSMPGPPARREHRLVLVERESLRPRQPSVSSTDPGAPFTSG